MLAAVERQSWPPDELAVADDGSGEPTAAVVRAHAARVRWPVHHAWQPHDGFRAGAARNAAVARTTADYLVLLDGDMVPDEHFLADHAAAARPRTWVQGCRLPLPAVATAAVLAGDVPDAHRDALDLRHRLEARRRPALARALAPLAPWLLAVKACNQGIWRADFVAANGYDETIAGWGAEDKELCARLGHAGIAARGLLGGALAWHLHHPPAPRDAAGRNRARLAATLASRRTRCEAGLDRHAATR